jgi:hypothetical protein
LPPHADVRLRRIYASTFLELLEPAVDLIAPLLELTAELFRIALDLDHGLRATAEVGDCSDNLGLLHILKGRRGVL